MSQLTVEQVMAANAKLREAIKFAIAPDMWIERENDIFEYRYVEWYVDVLKDALAATTLPEPEAP